MTSLIRYTPEKIAWENTLQQMTALEMGIQVWMSVHNKNMLDLLHTWKIGMIQGLIDSDEIEEDFCLGCETGSEYSHSYNENCACSNIY